MKTGELCPDTVETTAPVHGRGRLNVGSGSSFVCRSPSPPCKRCARRRRAECCWRFAGDSGSTSARLSGVSGAASVGGSGLLCPDAVVSPLDVRASLAASGRRFCDACCSLLFRRSGTFRMVGGTIRLWRDLGQQHQDLALGLVGGSSQELVAIGISKMLHQLGDVGDEHGLDTPRVLQNIRQTNKKLVIRKRFQFILFVHALFITWTFSTLYVRAC